jgi:hypothetical protein
MLLGCGILEPRLPFELPEENLSTDPADLRPGDFVWECERWWRGRPAADEIMVDVLFIPQVYPPPDVPHPTAKQRGLVERLGGVIVRPFNFAGLRVWMQTDSVLKLAEMRRDSLYPIQLFTVPDPRRYDPYVDILFASDTDFDRVALRFSELGGVVILHGVPNSAVLILPNRAIPEVRRLPGVASVYPSYPLPASCAPG